MVEAAVRSGALNTANWAAGLNRVADGGPRPGDQRAVRRACTSWSAVGAATLVTSAADVLELLGAAGEHLAEPPRAGPGPATAGSTRHQQVLDAVPGAAASPASTPSPGRPGIGLREVRHGAGPAASSVAWSSSFDAGWRLAALAHT